MTYVALTPLASDSPGTFPAQSQQNFTILQEIITADHQFNNTSQPNDGYHNLVHLTQQSPAGALADVGRLYSKIANGTVELFYMNDIGTENQITPESSIGPIKLTGRVNLAGGASHIILLNPTYDYTAIATGYVDGTTSMNTFSLIKSGNFGSGFLVGTTQLSTAPTFGYIRSPTPSDPLITLVISNITGAPQNVVWSIMLNRTT